MLYSDENEVLVKENIREFILGGHCNTTIVSTKTGKRYTYIIEKSDINDKMYFVKVMREYNVYVYAGMVLIDNKGSKAEFKQGAKGKLGNESESIKAVMWVINRVLSDKNTSAVEIYHLGKCGVCGRTLTDNESIVRGIGPTCYKKVCKRLKNGK